ncbi:MULTISPECIES: FAD:protein FMN transferase [unclassified Ectothiorhodospira]|uniref:FAD:protein FMN transferase n=1 Tax=unclassified Ectothiorhodospira TaxID=2684909 RepID=UPI001EE897B4|nr:MULTISPECIES: FAD:protein FMN transferase [unclassified Ectothiorhodospira]MCG5514745.1 FAD:protein FMN transferase [Ectothiorhodospira sp. 9100]MCG5518344.1 FAD:protein FMN transferase [Ectothiorhodospira sp. 9905]
MSRGMLRKVTLALVIAVATALMVGCERPEIHRDRFIAFGTIVELNIYTADRELARTAAETVQADLDYMHGAWHAWEPGAMGRTNQLLATGMEFSANPSVLPLIIEAQRLSEATEGLFNPALGQLFALWGFQSDAPQGPPPAEEEIQAILDQDPTMDDVHIDGIRMRSSNTAVRLDLGAYAKGYGLHQAMEHLKELGVEHAILNAGGDLRAIGRPGNRPWRIGVRSPEAQGVIAAIETQGDEAVFTSGDYERFFMHEGERYHHILDPRTGHPARGTRSVTVIHQDAAKADVASTALFIAGADDWPRIAARLGIEKVMLIDDAGVVYMTPAMEKRVRFESEPKEQIITPLPDDSLETASVSPPA